MCAAREIYRKLTSPPPDPLMMAMTMQMEEVDIDEDPTKLQGNRVFLLIASFFLLALVWATLTELDEVVRAEGTVVPPSSVQLVQNRLPGSLITIKAKLGDRVEKGDVLFQLEDEDVIANFDDNEITRLASLAMIARLEAEAEAAETAEFPEWLEKAAPDVVANERSAFEKRHLAFNARLTVFDRQIRENAGLAENLEKKNEIYKPLVEAGHEARLVLVDLEGQHLQANLQAARELAEVRTRADQAGAREDAFRAKVRHAEVRAPASGVVSVVHVQTVGAVVDAGTVLAEIVPDEQALLVKARVLAEDISGVYVDQLAQVALSAYDVSRYGNLEGRVQRIASNTMIEEGQAPYYQTMVEVPNPKFSKSAEKVEIVPGMTVVIDIIGKKRSVLSYIMTPLNRASGVVFRER
ncbi:MAG: HlyD family efflux transporter periplasmic adaptor subunit [Parvibaculales bacterium]